MSRKEPFTEREIALLKANPYTALITPAGIVRHTVEFKEFVYSEWQQGTKPSKIYEKAGYKGLFTTSAIGISVKRIVKEAQSEKGFTDPLKSKAFSEKELEKEKYTKAIKELQDRIVFLEQEINFLKKISAMNSKGK